MSAILRYMITAENVRYFNKALRLLVDNKGTTTYAIEAICNGDAEFAESIANELIERGFATKYSSMYFNLNQDWKAKEFLKGGGFSAELQEKDNMINGKNVKYYDLVLSHLVNANQRDVDIKELTDICDGDRDLAKVIAQELYNREFVLVADTRGEYSIALKRNGKASVFLKSGGFKAVLDKQEELLKPPKTRQEKMTDFLYEMLRNDGRYLPVEEEPMETYRIYRALLSAGLTEKVGSFLELSEEGIQLTERGDTYHDYLDSKAAKSKVNINNSTITNVPDRNTVVHISDSTWKQSTDSNTMKKYNLYISTNDKDYNILTIEEDDLKVVVDAYHKGEGEYFIGGERFSLKNCQKIKIYESVKLTSEDAIVAMAERDNLYSKDFFGRKYLTPQVLSKIGDDVTRDFIKGGYGYTKAETATMDTKSKSEFSMDIFISHSNADAKIAKAVISLIREALSIDRAKIRCTSVSGYKLPTGANSDEQIKQEIFNSKVFIAIITNNSIKSTYVTFELGARWGTEMPLLPLVCDPAGISLLKAPLTGINAMDATRSADILQFVAELGKHLDIKVDEAHSFLDEVEVVKELSSKKREISE